MTRLSKHQRTLIQFAKENGNNITKRQACQLIPFYHNTQKHVGDILSRMVKSKMLVRVKNGVYELNTGTASQGQQSIIVTDNEDLNQPRPQLALF